MAHWWKRNWPLPAATLGAMAVPLVVAILAVEEWWKEYNWWLVIVGASGVGAAVGTAVANTFATKELSENQQRVADLTEVLADTAKANADRDRAKPEVLWTTDYPYVRDSNETGYRIYFNIVNRGHQPTSLESVRLVFRNPASNDPLLPDSYEWPGKICGFMRAERWTGQGDATVPGGTNRAFRIERLFTPKELKGLREMPPLLVVKTVVGECESSVVGTGQRLDEDDPAVAAFLEAQEEQAEAAYREYRRTQQRLR